MLWRFSMLNVWNFYCSHQSSTARSCSAVWWGEFGIREAPKRCWLCQRVRAGVTHASLHSSVCPLLKQNCQLQGLPEQWLQTVGPTGSMFNSFNSYRTQWIRKASSRLQNATREGQVAQCEPKRIHTLSWRALNTTWILFFGVWIHWALLDLFSILSTFQFKG